MKRLMLILTTVLTAGGIPIVNAAEQLKSGAYYITQSWTQETAFKRPYYVSVPESADQQKFPVFIFLHGHGGNAKGAMNEFMRRYTTIATRYVMVFANGYKTGWNIVSEHSKADDLGFIEAIVKKLSTYDNIQEDNFSVMGNSNGAALVNQLAIESKLPNLRNYVTAVSPLNVYQHDGKNFKAKGADNNYQVVATPMTGKRLMNISGTTDDLVPYRGGPLILSLTAGVLQNTFLPRTARWVLLMPKNRFFSGRGRWDTAERNYPTLPESMAMWKSSVTSMVT